MADDFPPLPTGLGPGSQPAPQDGGELEFLAMPQDMRTYSPHVPDLDDAASAAGALAFLNRLADAADRVAAGGPAETFDLDGMPPADRRVLAETLGHGEVSAKLRGIPAIAVQETVFAGVWMLSGAGVDRIEVAQVPAQAMARAFDPLRPTAEVHQEAPGVVNAPPVLAELRDKSAAFAPGAEAHVVNLTLLPHTEADLAWLDTALGEGSVTILSRGYGNCRITATALDHVWRVQFFNSMDTLILDTFEVTAMPEVALAAHEDLADSAARIRDVLEAIG